MTVVTKLNRFFEEELQSELRDILITKDSNGSYSLFGKYTITPTKNGYYKVKSNYLYVEFTTIKNALAYVTLHNAKKYTAANRIQHLDLSLCSVNVELQVHRNILKSKVDPANRLIYIIKIQEDTIKKRRIVEEIKSYINSSIQIQSYRFNRSGKPNFKYK
jgi:hypothetical protein